MIQDKNSWLCPIRKGERETGVEVSTLRDLQYIVWEANRDTNNTWIWDFGTNMICKVNSWDTEQNVTNQEEKSERRFNSMTISVLGRQAEKEGGGVWSPR